MWTPDWLYQRLPLAYIAIGALCLLWLGTSFAATLSAFHFFAAALLTYWWRRRARPAAKPVRIRGRARRS